MAVNMGLGREDASNVYYTTLLRFVGCTAPMPEYAAALGSADVEIRARGDMTDFTNPKEAMPFMLSLGATLPAWRRPAVWANVLVRGRSVAPAGVAADCEVAVRMAQRFQMHDSVLQSLGQTFERWDGHGSPNGIARDAIAIPARLANTAFAAVMFHEVGGREAAVSVMQRWSGRSLDPLMAEAFLRRSGELLEIVESKDAWLDALEAEPSPPQLVPERRLDEVIRGFADFVDLKSTYLHGHSSGVAAIAEAAARTCNMTVAEVTSLRRAGLLHDLGRAGVPTAIWEKRGPLTTPEWEVVRLHPYHTERILSHSPALAPLAQLAGMHHERVDGSGYHRGAPASAQPKAVRLLAAADVYQALIEDRPHRRALTPEAAGRVLEAQPGLDREAVSAVLEAAGHQAGRGRLRRHARLAAGDCDQPATPASFSFL